MFLEGWGTFGCISLLAFMQCGAWPLEYAVLGIPDGISRGEPSPRDGSGGRCMHRGFVYEAEQGAVVALSASWVVR